ncbi:MAG: hypothetical protein U1F27_04795 [Turneriella sp.]
MKKTIVLALLAASTGNAWAEAAPAKPAYAKGRQASISLWGGYTPYVGAVDQNSYKSACEVYTNAGGSCTNKLGGLAGGIDLWMGNVAQLGFAAQYFQAGSLDGNSSTTTSGVLPGSTITTKTTEKLNSQFIPLLAQFRIHPKFFYIGIGAGVAINITNYEFSINGNSVSGRQVSNPTGFLHRQRSGQPAAERRRDSRPVRKRASSRFSIARTKIRREITLIRRPVRGQSLPGLLFHSISESLRRKKWKQKNNYVSFRYCSRSLPPSFSGRHCATSTSRTCRTPNGQAMRVCT